MTAIRVIIRAACQRLTAHKRAERALEILNDDGYPDDERWQFARQCLLGQPVG